MLNDIDRVIIDEAWKSVVFKRCLDIDPRELTEEQRDLLNKLCVLFPSLVQCEDLTYGLDLIQNSEFKDEEKKCIKDLFENKCKVKTPGWSVDVVLGNSICRKSFHPKITMSLGEHVVEMNATNFGKLRHSVAEALQRLDSYS
uniref:COMM domain-containing protein n=1 Tax=Syphacia muris TaxID=451379 RepID=A0A0N5AY91_9BILA